MKKIALITNCLLATLLLISCSRQEPENTDIAKPIPVGIVSLQEDQLSHTIQVSGNAEGNKTVKLGFMVAGRVNFIAVQEGEKIRKGKLLASLDPENYLIAKELADASVEQVQDEYSRLNRMHERQSIAESDFVKISAAFKQAKAQQKLHAKNLAETRISAPFTGVLLKKMTEIGEIIGTGLPLFVLSDIDTIAVNASIPENELHLVHPGDTARVFFAALDSSIIGIVDEIAAMAEPTTRTFNMKIKLANPENLIKPGMTAELTIETDVQESVLTIPSTAILRDIDKASYVYIADDQKNIAVKRMVSPGRILDDKIEITAGLSTGDLLIVAGQHKLSEGMSIAISRN